MKQVFNFGLHGQAGSLVILQVFKEIGLRLRLNRPESQPAAQSGNEASDLHRIKALMSASNAQSVVDFIKLEWFYGKKYSIDLCTHH